MLFDYHFRKQYTAVLLIGILLFSCSPKPVLENDISDDVIEVIPTQTVEPTIFPSLPRIIPSEMRTSIGSAEDRMAEPIMPEYPSQADLGIVDYWLRCMACHGDVGQGLTEEWREAWGPEEMNCWQSKCHGSSHPPNGFQLMEYAPPVFSEISLLRFPTAQDYFNYISTEMPWWKPGSLTEEQYWHLTAYMLRENGVEFDGEISSENASRLIIN